MNADVFDTELEIIQDITIKEYVAEFLNTRVPDYFFIIPASSSGKYHPKFSSGEGGLVRHTKMVVEVLKELRAIQNIPDDVFDCLVAACILHDTFKHGITDSGKTVFSHPVIAAEEWADFINRCEHSDPYISMEDVRCQLIYYGILKHMGQWGPYISKRKIEDATEGYCAIVHIADYIASRKFFDMYK